MLAGLFPPDAGRISVDDIDVLQQPRAALARMGILGDAHGLYPRLTARENIAYFGRLQGMDEDAANARAESLSQLLDMKAILDRRADGFSQGERMKTALARALVHDPANIVLDRPTNGLDVLATRGPARGAALARSGAAASASSSPRTSCKRWSCCATRSSSSPTARAWRAAACGVARHGGRDAL